MKIAGLGRAQEASASQKALVHAESPIASVIWRQTTPLPSPVKRPSSAESVLSDLEPTIIESSAEGDQAYAKNATSNQSDKEGVNVGVKTEEFHG